MFACQLDGLRWRRNRRDTVAKAGALNRAFRPPAR
jgi:hypothetical protein